MGGPSASAAGHRFCGVAELEAPARGRSADLGHVPLLRGAAVGGPLDDRGAVATGVAVVESLAALGADQPVDAAARTASIPLTSTQTTESFASGAVLGTLTLICPSLTQ